MKVRAPLLMLLAVTLMLTVSTRALAVPILDGTVTFIGDGGDLVVDITYAVYAPGDTDSPLNPAPGNTVVEMDGGVAGLDDTSGLYTYFYEISNVSAPGAHGVSGFSLGMEGFTGQYLDVGYLDGSGDVTPFSIGAGSGSVITLYFGDFVYPGETSDTLFVTSEVQPGTVYASVINGGMSGEERLPAPVPEPSSMLLLGSVASGLIAARRARAKRIA